MPGKTVTQHHRVRGGEAVRSTPPAGLETDCSTAGLAMLWKPHARSPGKHVARPEEDGPGSRKVETADWETKQTRVRGTRLLTTSRSPPPRGFTTTRQSGAPLPDSLPRALNPDGLAATSILRVIRPIVVAAGVARDWQRDHQPPVGHCRPESPRRSPRCSTRTSHPNRSLHWPNSPTPTRPSRAIEPSGWRWFRKSKSSMDR